MLIIEDEPLISLQLEELVTGMGNEVVGIATTHEEAVELFNATRPGLVLADIQLADGSSGIDAVNEILEHFPVPVIFITAFPERLLTGERPEPHLSHHQAVQRRFRACGHRSGDVLRLDRADRLRPGLGRWQRPSSGIGSPSGNRRCGPRYESRASYRPFAGVTDPVSLSAAA